MKTITMLLVLVCLTIISTFKIDFIGKNQVQPILNCVSQDDGECLQCVEGYFINQKKTCSIQNSKFNSLKFDKFMPCQNKNDCKNSQGVSLNNLIKNSHLNKITKKKTPRLLNIRRIDQSKTNDHQFTFDAVDFVKNQDGWIYTISGNFVSIVSAYPISLLYLLHVIQVQQGFNPKNLLIQDQYLGIFGLRQIDSVDETQILIYNIANKVQPILTANFTVQGIYFAGGKNQRTGFVYLLTQTFQQPIMPWYNIGAGRIYLPFQDLIVFPGHNIQNDQLLLNIIGFDLGNPSQSRFNLKSIILDISVEYVYMSFRSIYFTFTNTLNDNVVTVITKIFIQRQNIIPFATNYVQGTIHNSFAMNQFRNTGLLRIATSVSNRTDSSSSSPPQLPSISIYVLTFNLSYLAQQHNILTDNLVKSTIYFDRRLHVVTDNSNLFVVIFQSSHSIINVLQQIQIENSGQYSFMFDQKFLVIIGQQPAIRITIYNVQQPQNIFLVRNFNLPSNFQQTTLSSLQSKRFLINSQFLYVVLPVLTPIQQIGADFYGANLIIQFNSQEFLQTEITFSLVHHFLFERVNQQLIQLLTIRGNLWIQQYIYTVSNCFIVAINILNSNRSQLDIAC